MIGRTIILVGASAIAFALIGPRLGMQAQTVLTQADQPAQDREDARLRPQANIASVAPSSAPGSALTRDGDSHFRADVMVNGHRLRMLVDSGASLVVLTEADARAAGLFLSPSDYTDSASTAGGTVKVAPVVIDRLVLGGIERRNVRAAVVPGGLLSQSLLGQSFLGQLAEVSIRDDVMRLR